MVISTLELITGSGKYDGGCKDLKISHLLGREERQIPNDNLFVCYYNVFTLIVHPLHERLCKLHLSLIKLVVIKKLCTLLFLTFN